MMAGEIYVSCSGSDNASGTKEHPLRTLPQALKMAREWRRLNDSRVEGGIDIYVDSGIYRLTEPILIRPEDSGTEESPTTIKSLSIDHAAVISGGVPVTGWHRGTDDERMPEKLRSKIWWADAPVVNGRIVESRQLWVDWMKAQRATQFPMRGMIEMDAFNATDRTIKILTPLNFEQLAKASQLELLVHQRWAMAILRVKSMRCDSTGTTLTFHEPESTREFEHPWPQPVIGGDHGTSVCCLQNALELLDEPGEWHQDYPSGRIYYYPRKKENMEKATVTIPCLDRLVEIEGNDYRQVHHITFHHLIFQETSWNTPSIEGHVTLQGGFAIREAYKLDVPGLPEKPELENQAWIKRPQAAVTASYANNLTFEYCIFRFLGSTGLDLKEAVRNSTVYSCYLHNIGGTGIMIGTFPDGGFETHIPYIPKSDERICSDITVDDNNISDVGEEDWGTVGIAAGYVKNTSITHNELENLPYSGICVGWGWTPLRSGMENNKIDCNFVHDFARLHYDVGGIYTLSAQPGSSICGNRIEGLTDTPFATNDRGFYIYLDEATDGFTIENNWCPEARFDSNRPGPNNHWGKNGPEVDESIKLNAGTK